MSEYIEVSQPLQFTDPNTPTRVGEIVENVSDIYNIPSPRLGMQVFVKSEKKSFVITSLKSKVIGGVDVPEAAVEAFEPVGAKSITWNNDNGPSNMNDFVVAGVYDIKGERTRDNDNLPILNTGGGHSFNARLTVLDSSISGSGKDDDKCITQVLSFSNRLGQGEVYIRTGKGVSLDSLTWEKWSTLQRNVNVGSLESKVDLKKYIDNGIYSGVFRYGSDYNNLRTFVMVVINDYAIGLSPRRVSQFLYSIDKATGKVSYEVQTCEDETWKGWEILNKGEIDSMIKAAIADLVGEAPETLDTLQEIAEWVSGHQDLYETLKAIAEENTKKISGEITRAKEAEKNINQNAISVDSLGCSRTTDDISLEVTSLDGKNSVGVTFPSATTESAGVMSANDKKEIVYNKTAIEEEIKRAKEAEANAIEQGKRAALIDMYRAFGASYNSSTDTFTFNTVTGLSWAEMAATYLYRDVVYRLDLPRIGQEISNLRVINPLQNIRIGPSIIIQGLNTFYGTMIELFALCKLSLTTYNTYLNDTRADTTPVCTFIYDTFRQCSKLKVVFPINIKNCRTLKKESFSGCTALEELRLFNLPLSLNLDSSPLISKASILYIVTNASPTTAITITLHADAYARLANDAAIVAALAAQPLVTLVSA